MPDGVEAARCSAGSEAWRSLQDMVVVRQERWNTWMVARVATLGHAYAAAGRTEQAHDILDRLLERSKQHYVPSYWIALVYTSMGKKDEAFA